MQWLKSDRFSHKHRWESRKDERSHSPRSFRDSGWPGGAAILNMKLPSLHARCLLPPLPFPKKQEVAKGLSGFVFKVMTQKLHTALLLTSHWPKFSHMGHLAFLAAKKAGKCSLQLGGHVSSYHLGENGY